MPACATAEELHLAANHYHTDLELKFFLKRGILISWEELFDAALKRAKTLQPEPVAAFSHSDDKGNGVAVLRYWEAAERPGRKG